MRRRWGRRGRSGLLPSRRSVGYGWVGPSFAPLRGETMMAPFYLVPNPRNTHRASRYVLNQLATSEKPWGSQEPDFCSLFASTGWGAPGTPHNPVRLPLSVLDPRSAPRVLPLHHPRQATHQGRRTTLRSRSRGDPEACRRKEVAPCGSRGRGPRGSMGRPYIRWGSGG